MQGTMENGVNKPWAPTRIRALMEKAGMRSNELAAAVGCHQLTIERWLRGERQPSDLARKTLERLEAEYREKAGGS